MSKIAEIRLNQGDKNPYHGKAATDWAERAALGVLADLLDRRGIKQELRQIEGDEDVTDEIVRDLADIIRTAHGA
jgi:hypothetical protein